MSWRLSQCDLPRLHSKGGPRGWWLVRAGRPFEAMRDEARGPGVSMTDGGTPPAGGRPLSPTRVTSGKNWTTA